jgi:thymidylate synthase
MRTLEAHSFSDAYPMLIQDIIRNGRVVHPRSQNPAAVATKEISPITTTVLHPRRHLITSAGRPVNVAFALAEVLWILQGRDDVEMLEFYNSNISQFSDNGSTFNAPYGHRLRHAFGFDQIEDVVMTLSEDPNSRQAVMNIWHPRMDRGWEPVREVDSQAHDSEGMRQRQTRDRACNLMSHLMIRDDKLQWVQFQRSNDAIWGVPYNWMQFSHLQAWIAGLLGIEMGPFHHVVHSMHIYERHWEEAERISWFDAYELLGEHPTAPQPSTELLEELSAAEGDVRRGTKYVPVNLGYWTGVLCVLKAHAKYRSRDDEGALFWLSESDPVYAAAQIHFYFANRWGKSGYGHIRHEALRLFDNVDIQDWIESARKR